MKKFLLLMSMAAAAPAHAEVTSLNDNSFISVHTQLVAVAPSKLWKSLINWPSWWPSQHSYSGKSPTLDPRAGGPLEERWNGNAVLHGTVVNVQPSKLLRIYGAFGPLQSMPVNAVLDIAMKPEGDQTRLTLRYSVAGPGSVAIAKPVDAVFGEAFQRLVSQAQPK